MPHTPLHGLMRASRVLTAGRLVHQDDTHTWALENAHARVPLSFAKGAPDVAHHRALARVEARWDGLKLHVSSIEITDTTRRRSEPPRDPISSRTLRARARALATTRSYFDERDFLEVSTPALTDEPGTDLYLEPFAAPFVPEDEVTSSAPRRSLQGYLHTSPEFMMKRMLSRGFERIWQHTRAWRNGEVTPLHAPEFGCVEWYRAWESLEAIVADTEQLVRRITQGRAVAHDSFHSPRVIDTSSPFVRLTMQEAIRECCGFDILSTQTAEELKGEVSRRGLLRERPPHHRTRDMFGAMNLGAEQDPSFTDQDRARLEDTERWLDLFFELQVTHLDDFLARLGAVVLTEWPAQLAVLAARNERDGRVADRFEVYVGGVECANGFRELTDEQEQRRRFEEDLCQRARLHRPLYPMPEKFLAAMRRGIPPSCGVAMGFDRVVMLATGARTISEVLPFSMRRNEQGMPEFG